MSHKLGEVKVQAPAISRFFLSNIGRTRLQFPRSALPLVSDPYHGPQERTERTQTNSPIYQDQVLLAKLLSDVELSKVLPTGPLFTALSPQIYTCRWFYEVPMEGKRAR